MNLSEFELFESNYDDVRFGPIDIYQNNSTKELNMVKQISFTNKEEYQHNVSFYKTRKKFKNPYLWEMLDLYFDDEKMIIQSRFIYPNEDLLDYS